MQRRQITLADGRYLIFYTFEAETARAPAGADAAGSRAEESGPPEPAAEPQAAEERRV